MKFVRLSILVLAVYVLSIGPVARLYGGYPPKAVNLFYAPLRKLNDSSETAEKFFTWYIEVVWKFQFH